MNDKEILPPKKMSTFFYENKLYEFTQKELPPQDRFLMREKIKNSFENKEKLGSALLALEYLRECAVTEVQSESLNKIVDKVERKKMYLKSASFFLSALMVLMFGFILLSL